MPPDVIGTLEQIREAAGYIAADTAGMTFEAFAADQRSRQAVERDFEIVGEAVNRLRWHTPELTERISTCNQIVALRNALIQGYDRINYPALWLAVQQSLPLLRGGGGTVARNRSGVAGPKGCGRRGESSVRHPAYFPT